MMRWFQALLPKEDRFFDLFAQHSQVVIAGAEALRAMLDGGEAVPRYYQIVMDREHDADAITREVLIAVRRTFITPFDRGNIRDLITSMDNTIDQMQKTAKSAMMFDIRTFTPQMREMGDAIMQCAGLIGEAVPCLRTISERAGRITQITEEVARIENVADELHDRGLKDLYQTTGKTDPMSFITGNEVYDHLEKVVDRFDDVANVIHGTLIEHV
jgi:predicted phosphate transport protein (TIGR00153 family)